MAVSARGYRNNGDYAIISEVYKGFPADQAGIKAGSLLKKVRW